MSQLGLDYEDFADLSQMKIDTVIIACHYKCIYFKTQILNINDAFSHVYTRSLILVYEVIFPRVRMLKFLRFWEVQFADYDAYRLNISVSLPG